MVPGATVGDRHPRHEWQASQSTGVYRAFGRRGRLRLRSVCAPAIAQGTARVVVIGGGFAGATCARQLKRFDPKIQVTLVETNPTFTACPFSNAVIAGLRELNAQQFTYEKVAADGVTLAASESNCSRAPGAQGFARGRSERCPTIA